MERLTTETRRAWSFTEKNASVFLCVLLVSVVNIILIRIFNIFTSDKNY